MKIGRLLARIFIGSLFIAHGSQKWFGWFGGKGIGPTGEMMDSLGMRPGRRNAHAAAAAETLGGAAIVVGAFTPAAAAALIGTMVTAIRTVHLDKGFFAANGGYEFNLTLIAALLALVDGGPGPASFDAALGIDETGAGWAVAALGAGALGSAAAISSARAEPEPAPQP